jgi:hypothetical protein
MCESEDQTLEQIGSQAEKILSDLRSQSSDHRVEPKPTTPEPISGHESLPSNADRKTASTQQKGSANSENYHLMIWIGLGAIVVLGSVPVTLLLQTTVNRSASSNTKSSPTSGLTSSADGIIETTQQKQIQPKKATEIPVRPSNQTPTPTRSSTSATTQAPEPTPTPSAIPRPGQERESVDFPGIDLPITNRLCNKKGNFCIYDLARLITTESGNAKYSFSEFVDGEKVEVHGTIEIAKVFHNNSGQAITFTFRDDQSTTTPGWAVLGDFFLSQDSARPGIVTTFRATQSFGSKSPAGVENKSLLFPN